MSDAPPHLNRSVPILPAPRLEESVSYYQKLGFVVGYEDGAYAILTSQDAEVHLFANQTLDPLENYAGCYFRVSGIEALFAAYRDRGARIISPLEAKPWGQREFALLDPGGNLLRFGQSLSE